MFASSHSKKGASRISPYLTTSAMPLASSRSGSDASVSVSISTTCGAHGAGGGALKGLHQQHQQQRQQRRRRQRQVRCSSSAGGGSGAAHLRLVEGADHVLARRVVHARLAAHRGVDLRHDGGGHLRGGGGGGALSAAGGGSPGHWQRAPDRRQQANVCPQHALSATPPAAAQSLLPRTPARSRRRAGSRRTQSRSCRR
jgi:hypothetical protein